MDHNKPCLSVAPVLEPRPTKLNPAATKPLLCNRPFGHEGNHSFSTPHQASIYEWTPSVLVRWQGRNVKVAVNG